MGNKGTKQKYYSTELKLRAVKEYLDTKLSYQAVCKVYGIRDKSSLMDWVSKYQTEGKNAFDLSGFRKRQISRIGDLERENEFLRLENEYLKKSVARERGCPISELNLWSLKNLK
jgi:transposase